MSVPHGPIHTKTPGTVDATTLGAYISTLVIQGNAVLAGVNGATLSAQHMSTQLNAIEGRRPSKQLKPAFSQGRQARGKGVCHIENGD